MVFVPTAMPATTTAETIMDLSSFPHTLTRATSFKSPRANRKSQSVVFHFGLESGFVEPRVLGRKVAFVPARDAGHAARPRACVLRRAGAELALPSEKGNSRPCFARVDPGPNDFCCVRNMVFGR